MLVRTIKIVLIVLLPLSIFTSLLYFSWGGKYYLEAKKSIARLSDEQKSYSKALFENYNEYLYSGILMGTVKIWNQGVWVWGAKGPRFFRSDEHTVYSYFQVCTPEILQDLKNGNSIKPIRNIYTDIAKWSNKVKVGEYITVTTASSISGGNLGRLREALVHDWWIFDPNKEILSQCKK
jgi:hypothetical protein